MAVAVVYFSEAGTTHQLAESIRDGVMQQGCVCNLLRVTADQIVDGRALVEDYLNVIDQADAVIFGSPTYMGGPAAQFKAFADASSDRWEDQVWNSKLAAGFTVGSSAGGDQLATLWYFTILAAQHGMLWVNLDVAAAPEQNTTNSLNTQLGFAGVAQTDTISNADRIAAKNLGSRVAMFCERLASTNV